MSNLVALGNIAQLPNMVDMGIGGDTTFTFDGAADLTAVIMEVPATGTISNVHYRINSVSSPVLTLRIELRTVSATTGQPSAAGTLYGSSTSITVANPTTGNKTAAVNCTGATVGDNVAVVFDLSAFTSGSFTLTVGTGGAPTSVCARPYNTQNTTGSASNVTFRQNAFALEYGSHVYYRMPGLNYIVGTASSQNFNSTTPRVGNRVRPTIAMRAIGVWCLGNFSSVDCFVRLRLQSDDSILGTCSLDKDIGAASVNLRYLLFDAGATVNLTAGTDYYVLMENTSASTNTTRKIDTIPETQQLDQLSGGSTCYGTSHNGSIYSDVNTSRYYAGLLIDQVGAAGIQAIGNAG